MNYATAAPDLERLPWLTDERRPARPDDLRPLVLWSFLAAVLIAGASYWMGMNSPVGAPDALTDSSTATISLPQPSIGGLLADDLQALAVPEARDEPAPVATARSRPRPARATSKPGETRRSTASKAAADFPRQKSIKVEAPRQLTLWPADHSAGAEGKVVRIGTFASSLQAKRGWRQIVRVYPGMTRLKAVVVSSPSLRNGRTYYRLQFGTTSQAHSEVLCQWMKGIGQSCIVVGLPQEARA